MPTTYAKAGVDVMSVLEEAVTSWHRELALCDVRVDVLMASRTSKDGTLLPGAVKDRGYAAAASVKVVPLKQRALEQGDALVTICAYAWKLMTEPERLALLDHELEHVRVLAEGDGGFVHVGKDGQLNGAIALDALGRPRLRLVLHDWQLGGFRSVAQRHGKAAPEIIALEACRDEDGQYYWDWDVLKCLPRAGREADLSALAAGEKRKVGT